MRRPMDVLLGLVHLGLAVGLVATSLAAYRGVFSRDIPVTLEAAAIGNALRVGSEVKFHGVPVGTVAEIQPSADGATVELLIDADRAAHIPRASVVRMTPESLFGERYVSIVPVALATSTSGSGTAAVATGRATDADAPLRAGDRLQQDLSDAALQAEDLFETLLPVLRAVEPAKLNAALGELATALRGQGRATGDALVRWGSYLEEMRPYVPALARDLELLGRVSHAYADATPRLLAGLDALTTTTGTLREKRADLDKLLASGAAAADDGAAWMEENGDAVAELADEARVVLEVLARYAPLFPCVASSVTRLMPRMDAALGAGTGEPGLHAEVQVVPEGAGDGGTGPAVAGCPSVRGGAR